ncbi:hypothetical protein JMUB7528_28490 [Staphylococcus aureus]
MVVEVWSKEGDVIENLPKVREGNIKAWVNICLLYTSPSPRDMRRSRMPSSA